MISFLSVYFILHISVCLRLWQLAGNCGSLREYGFEVANFPPVVDVMDKDFFQMMDNGSNMFDADFIIIMFKKLMNKLLQLKEYLDYMFE